MEHTTNRNTKTCIIANKYTIVEKIGEGKFGNVYKGEHVKTNSIVAIKLEKKDCEYSTIRHESMILNYLYSDGCRTTPAVLWYGIFSNYRCLVMDYYDTPVSQYISDVKTHYLSMNGDNNNHNQHEYMVHILKLLANMVNILGHIHKRKIIHRDIKPDNFMMRNKELFLIDFGLATSTVRDQPISSEPNIQTKETIIGTPKYISYYVHDGCESSYRDDLIPIVYIFFSFLLGDVPWSNISNTKDTQSTESIESTSYNEIHILHPKNLLRKKWKQYSSIEKIFDKLYEQYGIISICGETKEVFSNVLQYFGICYHLIIDEMPDYSELCDILLHTI